MEGWQQDWFKMFETITQEVHQLFEDLGRDLAETTDSVVNLSEEIAQEVESSLEQFDQMITPKLSEWDEQIGQWLDPLLQVLLGLESTIDRAVEPVTHTVEPWLNQHPVCMGCRYYHGQEYNGNLLVCAMHPYGVGDGVEECPDKENVIWPFSDYRNPWDDQF